jgi:hypothetical protein
MHEAKTSSVASSGGSFLVPSLSTSARGELAVYVNEKQVLLAAIAAVTLADETAGVETLKLVLAELNDKATRLALNGNKLVSTAHPAFAVIGGLAKAYTISLWSTPCLRALTLDAPHATMLLPYFKLTKSKT